MPNDLPPGDYSLVVSVADRQTNEVIPAAAGSTEVEVAIVKVVAMNFTRWDRVEIRRDRVVCLALTYSMVNPLFESPDEFLHYEFVRYLVDRHELPVQTLGKLSEFHQPPLYYALTALTIGGIQVEPFVPIDNPFWGYDTYRFGVDNKVRYIHSCC